MEFTEHEYALFHAKIKSIEPVDDHNVLSEVVVCVPVKERNTRWTTYYKLLPGYSISPPDDIKIDLWGNFAYLTYSRITTPGHLFPQVVDIDPELKGRHTGIGDLEGKELVWVSKDYWDNVIRNEIFGVRTGQIVTTYYTPGDMFSVPQSTAYYYCDNNFIPCSSSLHSRLLMNIENATNKFVEENY